MCSVIPPQPVVTNNPKGFHDGSDCSQSAGWACDADNYNQALDIHFYRDGPAGGGGTFIGSVSANQPREAGVGAECGGNSNHGFVFTTQASLKDGNSHTIYAYAINIGSGTTNPLLTNSPKTINCNLPSTVDIKANGSDGPISITYNTSATLSWTSINTTARTASNGWSGSKSTSGSESTGNLTSSKIYTLIGTGPGGSVADSVTVNVGGAPTLTFTADSTSIPYNTGTTLRWSSANTVSCTASGAWSGGKSLSGSEGTGNLTSSKTYNLTCSNVGGSVTKSVTVSVSVPPPGNFTLTRGSVSCNSVPLSWTAASGAQAYRILRGSPRVDISPYQPYTAQNFSDTSVSQNTTYPYQIEAYNSGGTNRSNTINVTTPYCPPTINLSANPTDIFQGQSVTLSWTSAYVTSCTASGGWSGSKPLNGSQVVVPLPPPQVTYTLTCSGPGGSASDSATINISPLDLPDWIEIIPR